MERLKIRPRELILWKRIQTVRTERFTPPTLEENIPPKLVVVPKTAAPLPHSSLVVSPLIHERFSRSLLTSAGWINIPIDVLYYPKLSSLHLRTTQQVQVYPQGSQSEMLSPEKWATPLTSTPPLCSNLIHLSRGPKAPLASLTVNDDIFEHLLCFLCNLSASPTGSIKTHRETPPPPPTVFLFRRFPSLTQIFQKWPISFHTDT